MIGQCLGLDIGTTNIEAYVRGKGIVVSQPSIVACDAFDGHVIAMGSAAKEMVGRNPSSIVIRYPFVEGVTADLGITQALITSFLDKYCSGAILKPNVVASVPSDLTSLEKKTVLDCLFTAGAARACLLPKPFAAAIGADVEMKRPAGVMVVDIGGGSTESAVLTMDDIASCKTLRVGSEELNSDIIKYLRHERNIEIGYLTAERIKREIGSAVKRDEEIALILPGVDEVTGAAIHFEITSTEVYFAIRENLNKIVGSVCDCIAETNPELVSDIVDSGITLTGGGALLHGIDRLVQKKTGIYTRIAPEPTESVVRGLAKTARNIKKIRESGFALKYLAEF